MKRDELLRTVRRVEHVQDRDGIQWCPSCGQNKEANQPHDVPCDMASAIAWLERLPAGCDLVGMASEGETLFDTSHPRGNGFLMRTWITNPDDLTKAGGKR